MKTDAFSSCRNVGENGRNECFFGDEESKVGSLLSSSEEKENEIEPYITMLFLYMYSTWRGLPLGQQRHRIPVVDVQIFANRFR